MSRHIWLWIVLVSMFGYGCSSDSNGKVIMRHNGKAALHKSGEKYDLAYFQGAWRYSNQNSQGELSTPYERSYSENRKLRLEPSGRVYLVSKGDPSDRVEVRVIAGEWQYNADGDWNLLLDVSD